MGIKNLPDILKNVPGIGVILIGEGDLSQELGIPRQYDHPTLRSRHMAQIVATCKAIQRRRSATPTSTTTTSSGS